MYQEDITIQDLIEYMNDIPGEFIIVVEGLDAGGMEDGTEKFV